MHEGLKDLFEKQEKVEKCSELRREVKKIWNLLQVVHSTFAKKQHCLEKCKASSREIRFLGVTCSLGYSRVITITVSRNN